MSLKNSTQLTCSPFFNFSPKLLKDMIEIQEVLGDVADPCHATLHVLANVGKLELELHQFSLIVVPQVDVDHG